MDRKFLLDICDAYLVDHNVYTDHPKKTVTQVKDHIVSEVLDLVQDLKENDIELYDQLWDRTKLDQQQIIKTYLDYCYEEEDQQSSDDVVLEGDPTVLVAVGMLTLTAMMLGSGEASRVVFKAASSIGKKVETLGKALRRQGRYFKFRYAIIQRNVKRCYIQCGVDDKDIDVFTYLQVKDKESLFTTQKAVKQGKCLRKCYIAFVIENIALTMQNYFGCLKHTGAFGQLDNVRDNQLITTISGSNLSSACKEHFDDAREAFSNFNDLLDFIYGNNEQEKQNQVQILQKKLAGSRNKVKQMNKLVQINPKYRQQKRQHGRRN